MNSQQQQQQQLLVVAIIIVLTGLVTILLHQKKNNTTSRYRAPIPYVQSGGTWSLDCWGDVECREYLRFTKAEVQQLIIHFGMGAQFRSEGLKYAVTSEQALSMMLYRLAWPTRLKDMIQIFGLSRPAISKVINSLVDYLYQRYQAKLFWDVGKDCR